MLWLILLAVFLVIFYLYTVKLNRYWKDRGVKHEFVIPPFGNNLKPLFKSQPFFEMVEEFYYKFPEERCTGLFQFTTPVLMLKDLELIKELCVKDFEYFLDHSAFLKEDTDPLWSKNLFALTGQKWRDMRATLSPSFTGSKMRQMFMLVQKCSENFVNYFEQNSSDVIEIELKDAFSKYTNDIIATTAFGIQCDSLENPENEFYVRGKQTTDFSGLWKNLKFMLVVMIPWLGKVLDSRMFDKEVSIFFKRIIKETLDYRKKNNIERPDMINLLMHAKKGSLMQDESKKVEERSFAAVEEHLESKHPQEMKAELSLEDITSQALIFFVAGFDTVSTAMCFMAYELALNPDIQQRLIMELDEHRAVNKNLTYEGLAELTYLDMVFSESLRKWPATIATDRQCVKPYTIKSDEQNNKAPTLTPGNLLWIPIWSIHHDPNYWENPDKFDPERFSAENKDKIVPYSYLPFGVGPRNCIGSRFAIMEVKAVFYGLLEKFEIVPTEKNLHSIQTKQEGIHFGIRKWILVWIKKKKIKQLIK